MDSFKKFCSSLNEEEDSFEILDIVQDIYSEINISRKLSTVIICLDTNLSYCLREGGRRYGALSVNFCGILQN